MALGVGLLALAACGPGPGGVQMEATAGAVTSKTVAPAAGATGTVAGAGRETQAASLTPNGPTETPGITATASTVLQVAEFDSERALGYVAQQLSFGPRIPGSEAHKQAADWIAAQLARANWVVEEQQFTYRGVDLTNIIAHSHSLGRQPEKKWILLGAHYDTRPHADQDPENPRLPVPGANDGGSGVAVLLELANFIPADGLPCELWLAFFDAEDSGGIDEWEWLVGSQYMAANLDGHPRWVVVVDMVGDADLQLYLEHNSDPDLADSIWAVAEIQGHDAFIPEYKWTLLDDHIPFLRRGIPAADIIDFDYPYWHTTADTLDKVSGDSLAQVGETLGLWLQSACR
jgi:glutaminyl-peptide cyclotransferase